MNTQQEPFILVTQSFGRESEYRRVVLMILSLYSYTDSKPTTILFTDNPEWFHTYFADFPLKYILLTQDKIRAMRGNIDFLHRMKIALIEESFQLHNSNILYADSDTFFIEDPGAIMQKVQKDKSFMHLCEYEFESLREMPLPAGLSFQAFVKLIESKTFETSKGAISISTKLHSWNAGVMMLHHSHQNLIQDVYTLTDQFYPSTKNHASEQYAFSILLQQNTELAPCESVIYHYWYNVKKAIIDEILPKKLEKYLLLTTKADKLNLIKEFTKELPIIFKNHVYTLKDNAIQDFNKNKFSLAYAWAIKALVAGAIKDKIFIKDILYHTKRQITKK